MSRCFGYGGVGAVVAHVAAAAEGVVIGRGGGHQRPSEVGVGGVGRVSIGEGWGDGRRRVIVGGAVVDGPTFGCGVDRRREMFAERVD